jgi:hypothetical protein
LVATEWDKGDVIAIRHQGLVNGTAHDDDVDERQLGQSGDGRVPGVSEPAATINGSMARKDALPRTALADGRR